MADTAPRVLVIAGGRREDALAAELIERFPGHVVADTHSIAGLAQGPAAMVAAIGPSLRFLREASGRYDKIVVIGGAMGLLLAWRAGLPVSIYLDIFKTGYAHRYSAIEKWAIGKIGATVFCRDDLLAQGLRRSGIDARSHGNFAMDIVPYGAYDTEARRIGNAAIALLPGTPGVLATQVSALEQVQGAGAADIFVALAPGIDTEDLADATGLTWRPPSGGEAADSGDLVGKGLVLHLVTGALGNVIEATDFVLAGERLETQQALGLGTPVIAIKDPTDRTMAAEQALMSEGRILVENTPEAIAEAVAMLLNDPEDRARRGAIGRERLGGPGTLDAVIAELFG